MPVCVWRVPLAAIAVSLCTLPVGAVATGRTVEFAQNASDVGRGDTEPSQPVVPDAPTPLPTNSPEQIKKAQTELRRLDCLKGRIDSKLGNQTRQAVKKFWISAGKPAVAINITDELISDLAERGDGFCRPARPFFAIGGRPSGNSGLPPLFAPGAPLARPHNPAAAH
jgi:hypothetical protein